MSRTILNIEDFSMIFGGLRAVDHVSMHIDEGEIVALYRAERCGKNNSFQLCHRGL